MSAHPPLLFGGGGERRTRPENRVLHTLRLRNGGDLHPRLRNGGVFVSRLVRPVGDDPVDRRDVALEAKGDPHRALPVLPQLTDGFHVLIGEHGSWSVLAVVARHLGNGVAHCAATGKRVWGLATATYRMTVVLAGVVVTA